MTVKEVTGLHVKGGGGSSCLRRTWATCVRRSMDALVWIGRGIHLCTEEGGSSCAGQTWTEWYNGDLGPQVEDGLWIYCCKS